MSIKRLIGATIFRTLLIGGVVTGLSFLFPVAMPYFIVAGAATLVTSVAVTIHKFKKNKYIDDIPIGDLEYYDLPEESFYSKVETKVLDTVEELPEKLKKIKKNKVKSDEDILTK